MKKEQILANCIEEIRSGKSTVEDCAKRYPQLENELRSLLEIAVSLQPDDVKPSAQFKERAKMHLFDEDAPALAQQKVTPRFWASPVTTPARVFASIGIAFVIFAAVGGSTVYAAQSSLPGDTLYTVKTGVENLQLAVTANPATKADLYLEFAHRRIDEIQRQVNLNRNVNAQALVTAQQQFDNGLKALSSSDNTQASNNTLSKLSVSTLNEQVELEQALAAAPQASQPELQQIIDETRRSNTIAQVAYANTDFLKNQPSVADKKLDAGQFNIEGTLLGVQGHTWNVGGTVIVNVHLNGKTPDVGSRVDLQGLVKDNNTYISKIQVSAATAEPTKVEGQFSGTNQNGTANISGIDVKISGNSAPPLTPGEKVQLQSGTNDGNLDVTSRNNAAVQSTTISGTLTAVETEKGTITVKVTGSHVVVVVLKARIENSSDSHQIYQLSDLKHYLGHDVRVDGLSEHDNNLNGSTVRIDGWK